MDHDQHAVGADRPFLRMLDTSRSIERTVHSYWLNRDQGAQRAGLKSLAKLRDFQVESDLADHVVRWSI
jgi:hypothetical protein